MFYSLLACMSQKSKISDCISDNIPPQMKIFEYSYALILCLKRLSEVPEYTEM